MKKILISLALTLAFTLTLMLTGCKTKHVIEYRDSIRTEIKTEIVKVPDTVLVEIPLETQHIETYDSTSFLENKWCKTTATITSGMLTHTLETKPQQMPVPTEKEIVYRDSIQYKEKIVKEKEPVYVEKELTWWQKTQMRGCWILLALLVISNWKTILKGIKLVLV